MMEAQPEPIDENSFVLAEAFDHFKNGRLSQAQAICEMLIKQDPEDCEALNLLSSCYLHKQQYTKAIECQEKLIEIAPENPEYLKNLELMLRKDEKFAGALEIAQKAIVINPEIAQYHYCVGLSLCHLWRLDEAIEKFKRTLALDPYYFKAHVMLGNTYQEVGDYEKAREHFRNASSIEPKNPYVTYNRGLLLMQLGEFEKGLQDYESRWEQGPPLCLPDFVKNKRAWNGKEASDKHLLLMVEQGHGDSIQFCRYFPRVTELVGKVTILCIEPLLDLLKPVAPETDWILQGDSIPDFNIYITSMSLPYVMKTRTDNVPADIPYLFADKTYKTKWHDKIRNTDNKKIAICWSGSANHPKDHIRSIKAEMIEEKLLSRHPEIDFYLMQKGRDEDKAAEFSGKYENVFELGSKIENFADSAAIVDEMDMVITVDTALAHLAGAMGRPVWNMLLFNADWRWLLDRKDSPWYPTMRLFRQPTRDNWEEVLNRVSRELRELDKNNAK